MNTAERITKKFIGAVEDEWQLYSDKPSDYTIGLPIGFGASSVVYAAQFQPPGAPNPTPCALKVLDLDRLPPNSLHLIQRETQLMSLSKHPNVLRVRGMWTEGHKLYIAMRLMNAGSAADVMRYGWPGGMEEEVVRCILKQALEGLNYLHINGLIHRDVKAANLLIDDDGTVLLGDLGVAAFLWENEDPITVPIQPSTSILHGHHHAHSHKHHHHIFPHPHIHRPSSPSPTSPRHNHSHHVPHRPKTLGKRKSFVGTPCWMAPEVITGKQYDASADIWSFGITALELCNGRAPRSRESPHSVLLHIVQDAPPKLDRENGPHKYSKAFADIIDQCLNKDPSKRPSAQELLQMNFFKNAKKKSYLVGTILKGLPPLTQRQERRKQPSILTHTTMDSWDFDVNSILSPAGSSRQPSRAHPLSPPESVFELEDENVVESPTSSKSDTEVKEEKSGIQTSGEASEHEEGAAAYAHRIRTRLITPQHAPRPHGQPGAHSRSASVESRKEPVEEHGEVVQAEESPPELDSDHTGSAVNTDSVPDTPTSSSPGADVDVQVVGEQSEDVEPTPVQSPALAAASRPIAIPEKLPVRPPPAAAGGSPSSSSIGTSESAISESAERSSEAERSTPSSSTGRRIWRRLTGQADESQRGGTESFRRKALSGLVRTVSRNRTTSIAVPTRSLQRRKSR
ncbi:kinase-like protein [Panus rudis PR-1116 ss-1]|nr:kinase-like protein [Panus rudis PR-1116 ss-1]